MVADTKRGVDLLIRHTKSHTAFLVGLPMTVAFIAREVRVNRPGHSSDMGQMVWVEVVDKALTF